MLGIMYVYVVGTKCYGSILMLYTISYIMYAIYIYIYIYIYCIFVIICEMTHYIVWHIPYLLYVLKTYIVITYVV